MRTINRDKEKLCEDFILKNYVYDESTGEIFSKIKNVNLGSLKDGYKKITTKINGKIIQLRFHRVAWLLYYKSWPENLIDHIDGDKLNNKIDNLRECNQQKNCRNAKIKNNNRLGLKNICEKKDKNYYRFAVSFTVNGKQICKYFKFNKTNREEVLQKAIEYRDQKRLELFKDFEREV